MRDLAQIQAINEELNGPGVWDGEQDTPVFWFDITGKVYADSLEAANELLYRYGLAAYPEIKISGIEIE